MSEIERPPKPDLPPTLAEADAEDMLGAIRRDNAEMSRLSGLQALPTPVRQGIAIACTLGILASVLGLQGLREDWTALMGPIGLLVIGAALTLGYAFRPIWRPNPHPGRRLSIAGAGLVLVAFVSIIPELWPGVLPPVSARPRIDAACATASAFDGGVVLLAFLLLDRHRGQRLFSAMAIGSTGALLAFAVQTLHCPAVHAGHLLVTHALAGALGGAVAYLLARRAAARARG
ncbi:MAG: hypothetical protein KC912_07075 [Proteobacteria bacterium]|nr:hypothetical protein [Pseudomonadota bacterium]